MPRYTKRKTGNRRTTKKRRYSRYTSSVPQGAKPSRRPVDPYVRRKGSKKEQKYFVTCTSAELFGDTGDSKLKNEGYVQALLENHCTNPVNRGDGSAGSQFPRYIYQGVGRNQRMGDQVYMKSLSLKFAMYFHEKAETAYGGNAEYRVAIVMDNQPSGSSLLSHSDLGKVYDFVDGHLNFSPNPQYSRRFTILKDELIQPRQALSYKDGPNDFTFETQLIRKEFFIPINRNLVFASDSQPSSMVNANLYLVLFSSINPTGGVSKERTKVHLDYQGTFLYEDL